MTDRLYAELQQRQQKLLLSLGEDILILPAGSPTRFDGARFRQNNDFAYFTGFPEQSAVAVFDPTAQSQQVSLFVRENTHHQLVWDGFTMGVEAAKEVFPADHVSHIDGLEGFLAKRLKGRKVYYHALEGHPSNDLIQQALTDQQVEAEQKGGIFQLIKEMRAVKSPLELEQMRKAIDITGEAFHTCMRAGMRHRNEYQFEAEFEYFCKMQGVLRFAFGSIVAAGHHATCQHYVDNSGPVNEGDMVLLDAGAIWNSYCADITRTFPASGKFSSIQRDLYEVVLASQKAGVAAVAPGLRLFDLHLISARILIDGLKGLGLVKGDTDEIIATASYKDYWPGSLCHSLGLDVHDVMPDGYIGPDADLALKPGMVITVEPGFYSQDFNHEIPPEYRRMGIRIEDDVLVTEDGYENLSIATVKEVADVEAMVQSGQ